MYNIPVVKCNVAYYCLKLVHTVCEVQKYGHDQTIISIHKTFSVDVSEIL